jgi:hypothetical protein
LAGAVAVVRLHGGDNGIESEVELKYIGVAFLAAAFHVFDLGLREEEAQILRVVRRSVRQRVGLKASHELVGNRLADDLVGRCVLIEAKPGEEPDDGKHRLVRLRVHLDGHRNDELRTDRSTLCPDSTAIDRDRADEATPT